jgi:hypothetical protein
VKKLILIAAIILLSSHNILAQMVFSGVLSNTFKIKPAPTMLLIFNNDGTSNIIFESGTIINCSHEWDRSIFTVECHNTTIENPVTWNLDGIFLPPLLLIGTVNCFIEDEHTVSNPQYLWGMRIMPYFLD